MSIADTIVSAPACPTCGDPMTKRNSARGSFWGCSNFPQCRGTRSTQSVESGEPEKMKQTDFKPIMQMHGTYEQEAIWDLQLNGTTHLVISAGPGTGKSWTMVQYCLRASRKLNILFLAFNKEISREATGKLGASGCTHVNSSTSHSYGNRILRKHFRNLPKDPNEGKMSEILEALSPMPIWEKAQWRRTLNLARKLCEYTKNYFVDYNSADFPQVIEGIADHHGLDFWSPAKGYSQKAGANFPGNIQEAIRLVPKALDICIERAAVSIDYDDMLWLPVVLNLPFEEHDIVIVDECQDLNALQHELVKRAGASGRVFAVGDPHQAIYQFRGAVCDSMQVLSDALQTTSIGVKTFPLTITQRCPVLHVQMAQYLYPDIQATEDAPLGEIKKLSPEVAIADMKFGDLVLCRVNKELVSVAYKLIHRGIRPVIKGCEIGKGLLTLLDKLEKSDMFSGYKEHSSPDSAQMEGISNALSAYRYDEECKLLPLGDKAAGRLEALHDKCECMLEFIRNSSSIADMQQKITSLFKDDAKASECVTLGTVHRTKGLESERVFILAPELIPHPAAKKDWEFVSERNLAWVACTRAKFDNKTGAPGTLIFCGAIPKIYQGVQYA